MSRHEYEDSLSLAALYPPARQRYPQHQRERHAPDALPPSRSFIPGGVQPEDVPSTTGEPRPRSRQPASAASPSTTTRRPAATRKTYTAAQEAWYEEAVRRGELLPDDWVYEDRRAGRHSHATTSTSAVRLTTSQARQQEPPPSAPPTPTPRGTPRRRAVSPRKRALLVGMLAMGALAVSANAAYSWWQGVQADLSYGYPRVYQTDAVVGHHHDSAAHKSHFLVLNLHGQVDIVELPAGDPSQALLYTGPTLTGPEADREVVTLSFQDVNHDGRPDLVLHVGATEFVLLNGTDGKFHQPSQPQQGQGQ